MSRRFLSALASLAILALSACNLPQQATVSPNLVATQVTLLLTQSPTVKVPEPQKTILPTVLIPPTETPENTAAPLATTAPPIATATAPETDPKLSLGDPTWKDTLDTGKNFYLYDDGHVKFDSKPGYLVLEAFKPENWYGWTLSIDQLNNFYMEATLKPEACSGMDKYGLMIRAATENEGYFYGFTCDGQYSLRKWDGSHFSDLIKWTANPAVVSGPNQSNRMGVMANGSHFSLYANGKQLGQVDDNTYSRGAFGFYVSSSKTTNFIVEADEIDYWTLP